MWCNNCTLQCILPKLKAGTQTYASTSMFVAALFTIVKCSRNNPTQISFKRQMNKMWYIHIYTQIYICTHMWCDIWTYLSYMMWYTYISIIYIYIHIYTYLWWNIIHDIQICPITWINLENMLSEISWIQKHKYMIPLTWVPTTGKFTEAKCRTNVTRGWDSGRIGADLCLMGTEFLLRMLKRFRKSVMVMAW